MKKNDKVIIAAITIIIIIAGITLIMQNHTSTNMEYKKILVLGIDGMDPKITNQLMQEGKLPNFAKLSQQGSFINLNTSYPPQSPVAWTSIATGVNPGKHNIFDFIRREPGSYLPELGLAQSEEGVGGTNYVPFIKAAPFWRITSSNGVPTTIIRWPVSFPPEQVKGNLLSGLGVPDVKGLLSGYAYYSTDNEEQDNKNIKVSVSNNLIETYVAGPNVRKNGKLESIKVPMKIALSGNSATINVDGKTYSVEQGQWTDWINVNFKTGIFSKVSGIFRATLISTDPFELYITTIQIDPKNPIFQISYPKSYSKELADKIGEYYTLGIPEETDGYVDGKIDAQTFLSHVSQIEDERTKMFWSEFDKFKKQDSGILAFVYDSSDRMQHVFWQQSYIKNPTGEIDISKEVENYWINKDKFIGEILPQIDNNTLLIILSDHGFSSFEKAISINTFFANKDLMTLNKPLGDNENALFQGVIWSKTKAYSLGFNSIFLNLKGREKEGIVDPKDKEAVEDEIISKLEALRDESGNKVINKVYKTSEIYSGANMANAPDLMIGFNPGYRMSWETAVGGFSKEIIYNNTKKWSGDHLIDPKFVPGILFTNVKLNATEANQMDIAPTILKASGIAIPSDIDGKSLI